MAQAKIKFRTIPLEYELDKVVVIFSLDHNLNFILSERSHGAPVAVELTVFHDKFTCRKI